MSDLLITQLQETGRCNVSGLSVADVLHIIEQAGLEPLQVTIDAEGNLRA